MSDCVQPCRCPLGRCFEPRNYPLALPPGPNTPIYPAGAEPAEKALDRDRPSLTPKAPPAARLLPR